MHFHTVGTRIPDAIRPGALQPRADRPHGLPGGGPAAVHITSFQMFMSMVLMGMIYGGVLERYPRITLVLGEGGIGWIPYILDRMDLEWEDQFHDLGLRMAPREYWRRQCKATFQSDKVGVKLLDELGVDNVMWASDFPHPDGIWPDSTEYIDRELGHLPADVRRKIVCDNAAKLYGFASVGPEPGNRRVRLADEFRPRLRAVVDQACTRSTNLTVRRLRVMVRPPRRSSVNECRTGADHESSGTPDAQAAGFLTRRPTTSRVFLHRARPA
jgi:hypothetical protein